MDIKPPPGVVLLLCPEERRKERNRLKKKRNKANRQEKQNKLLEAPKETPAPAPAPAPDPGSKPDIKAKMRRKIALKHAQRDGTSHRKLQDLRDQTQENKKVNPLELLTKMGIDSPTSKKMIRQLLDTGNKTELQNSILEALL